MGITSMASTNHTCVHATIVDGVPVHGWRWYFTYRSLPWASENGRSFHQWIQLLKKGHAPAERLFANVYRSLWGELLEEPEAFVTVPPSVKYSQKPDYPLHRCAEIAASLGAGVHLKHHIKRKETLPKCVDDSSSRSFHKQRESMSIDEDAEPDYTSIAVIDDVRTSGSTLHAAIDLLRHHHPEARIIALAFGQTQATGSTPFPEEPNFQGLSNPSEEDLARFML